MWICDINNQLRGRRVCMLSRWLLLTVVFSLLFSHSVCPILSHPMDCSTPFFPVLHHLPKIAQTHVHWAADAIQPSHPLLPPSLPALSLSQHQGLFQRDSSLYQVVKILELQLQHQSSNQYSGLISFRIDWLDLLAVQRLSRVLSNNTIQKHKFFSAQPSLGFPCGSAGKESACNVGDGIRSLGWEDPLEKGKATHSSILA